MDLHGHLLYVDITQICGIGCAFCMYADKHVTGKSMVLSTQARDNLSALINDPSVKRISVSGEGEPLNNIHTFYELLALSRGATALSLSPAVFSP
jgi:adenine C2-methylase RlmN of 23S rRNA A2503 and tRNA A37